ncbi:MAG: hypothetical protein V1775_17455 [Bacteroidota bacterium]
MLIVGGGSEKNGSNSWSTPPYRWAVEGKRVAIIGTETGSLAPYMESQCGASRAKEFAIATRDSADSQATYDTLMSYEVIFFRGGDQWEYYDLYRNTRLQDAVNHKFVQGGCIGGTSAGMHILSSIVFTAENGTVYPYECIENPNNNYVTLESDFLALNPGFIFDTHFCERARFGRLAGFLANYRFNQNEEISGLGMDDMTCMTIDENGLGTVYGTGCANFYRSGGGFSQNSGKLLADSVEVIQLLKGCTYNFTDGETGFQTLDRQINTSGQSETGNYTVLASGSNLLNDNLTMLTDLVSSCGLPEAGVIIFSGDNSLAESFRIKILEAGAVDVSIFDPVTANGSDTELAAGISQASKILFIENNETSFSQFLQTPNGILLQQKLQSDGMISAFAGQDARLAGKTIIGNYLEYLASWYGELTFTPGLGLLKNTVIMPETFLNSDIYENTATAVPYAMARDTAKYGIWLTNHNYMKFSPVDGKTWLTGYGTAPVMVIANVGTKAGFSHQTGTGGPGAPRMVAGFEKLSMDFIDYTTPYPMGDVSPAGVSDPSNNHSTGIFPNPARKTIKFIAPDKAVSWKILSLTGIVAREGLVTTDEIIIEISALPGGTYLLLLIDGSCTVISETRFIKVN